MVSANPRTAGAFLEPARFADVLLDVPSVQLDEPFTYAVGEATMDIGSRVRVPFGKRMVSGWVVGLRSEAGVATEIKSIAQVLTEPPLDPGALELARWVHKHYACTLREALTAVVPRASRERERFCCVLAPEAAQALKPGSDAYILYRRFGVKKFSALAAARELRRKWAGLALPEMRRRLARLVSQGVLERTSTVAAAKRRRASKQLAAILEDGSKAKSAAARRLVHVLSAAGGRLPLHEAKAAAQAGAAAVRSAQSAGVLRLQEAAVAFTGAGAPVAAPLIPTSEQREAIERIDAAMRNGPVTALLAGITGSGKTFVYSRLIDRVRSRGGRAIVLVPEIALTPQTAARFAAVFGSSVGVLHSGLSDAQRAAVWRDAQSGSLDVVVGARSAVFAPLPDVRLIVVDEEHEPSYKQDVAPRYHAAAVARERMRAAGAVVLGSATPSLESYAAALGGDILLVQLTQRATAAALPPVEIVDMTSQRGPRGRRAIGPMLASALETALARGEKSLLFVNRRGYAGLLLCRSCGFAPRCRRCAVSLVVHAADRSMRCHVCGAAYQIPPACPKCKSADLLPFGFGTQRLEEEVKELLPDARVVRMDADTTGLQGAHERILTQFAHEGDILIGTQMIAKGLDYPAVTLVGVVAADQDLNRPDFRAAERTFSLLTQVAGRAGRVRSDSRVVVQSYTPDHYAITLAARHDYEAFAAKELPIRRELHYPPFGRLAYVIVSGLDSRSVSADAAALAADLRSQAMDVEVLGPAPDVLPKAKGEFRERIALKSADEAKILEACTAVRKRPLHRGARCTVIVDPR